MRPALGWWSLAWFELFALAVIAAIDYRMGERAQMLNGYEILRRTFARPLGVDAPAVTDTYIVLQAEMGGFALAWAWALYLLWGLVFAFPLHLLARGLLGKA